MDRYTKKSMQEILLKFQQMHTDLHLCGFRTCEELVELDGLILQNEDATRDELFANVEMEWVGSKIPIEEISTPVAGSADIDYIICRRQITPPGLSTKPCDHTYCETCLEHWIHAAEKASHTCPYCRTQLFPEPTYRVKDLKQQRNYGEMLRLLDRQAAEASDLVRSLGWLTAELELQKAYENDRSNSQQIAFGETTAVPM
jgi:hypothetical protein